MARTKVDEATARRELERRMAAQWSEARKIAAADSLVDNSGSKLDTETRVREVYTRLKSEAVGAR